MEPTVVAAVTGFLAARGTTFFDAILKPIAGAIGDNVLANYQAWQARNVADVFNTAGEMLVVIGKDAGPVPGRILFPILDYAAVETEDEMKTQWAALLANASTGVVVLPAYAEILRQLTPVHARFIDFLTPIYEGMEFEDYRTDRYEEDLKPAAGIESGINYDLVANDLHRLGLIEPRSGDTFGKVRISGLGIGFLKACTPPAEWPRRKRSEAQLKYRP